jgi:HEPN superfamily AbiU2-like protein
VRGGRIHQRLLHHGVLLTIQKLLDPAISSRGKQSASLEMLLRGLPPGADATLTRRLKKCLDAMRTDCSNIKEWRNRKIAHLDLPTVLIQAL